MSILIERRLGTAPLWMPVERGWIEPDVPVTVVEAPGTSDIRAHKGLAIVDTLLGSTALANSVIVSDFAVVATQISLLTLVTADRPDEVERASVSAPGVSLTGRATAEIVIPTFYGIEIASWLDEPSEVGPESMWVTEDEQALLPTLDENHYHEDLGRAWFLMTNTPFVSHICLAPAEMYEDELSELAAQARVLRQILEAADEQRRMLRRNISRDHGIDRDVIVDVFDGLQFQLGDSGVDGLSTLFHRTGVLSRTGPIADKIVKLGHQT